MNVYLNQIYHITPYKNEITFSCKLLYLKEKNVWTKSVFTKSRFNLLESKYAKTSKCQDLT